MQRPLSLLQQLDLHLAEGLVDDPLPKSEELIQSGGLATATRVSTCAWISAVLGLRGLLVHPDDVSAVLTGRSTRYVPGQHEHGMILGLRRVLQRMYEAFEEGRPPDGWWVAELFREFSREVPRFRNNVIRRGEPWDAVLYVKYPDATGARQALDRFTVDHCYGDHPLRFRNMHPVRQSFRVLWRMARIAPFPDFNLTMAFVAMSSYLLYCGYPIFVPHPEDRALMHRMVSGPNPARVAEFEQRLLTMTRPEV